MSPNIKLDSYKQVMAARGVSATTAFPPLWHVLWAGGLRVPPPGLRT